MATTCLRRLPAEYRLDVGLELLDPNTTNVWVGDYLHQAVTWWKFEVRTLRSGGIGLREKAKNMSEVTLFDRVGGKESVEAAVDLFYYKVVGDPELSSYFDGIDLTKLKAHQRSFLTSAMGGPDGYTGADMGPAHAGLGITNDHFDLVVGHLVETLTELEVPGDVIEEIGGALVPLRDQIVSA